MDIPEIRLDRWADYASIRPGIVGSVGDVLLQTRLKHNFPDAPLRWEYGTVGDEAAGLGSNVQNGYSVSYASGGGPAKLFDSNWQSGRSFKTNHGWIYQDIRVPDKRTTPLMGDTPDYSWNNKIAATLKAKLTGEKFLPVPGGYAPQPGQQLRGGTYPIVRNEADNAAPPGGYDSGIIYGAEGPKAPPAINQFVSGGTKVSLPDLAYKTVNQNERFPGFIGASDARYKSDRPLTRGLGGR
jgi:hypothetical protein